MSDAVQPVKRNNPVRFSRHKNPGSVCAFCLLAVTSMGAIHVHAQEAQPYVNADGTWTSDLEAAAQTWRNDAEFKAGGQLGSIKAEYAYAMGFSGRGVKVGVFDTGVLGTHPEFAGPGKLTGLHTEGTYAYTYKSYYKAGDPFSFIGTNPMNGTGLVSSDTHGTHVAGIVAANRDGAGMMGVAYRAALVAAHNSDPGPEDGVVAGNDANAYAVGFKALAASGVRIINNSWGVGFLGSLGLSQKAVKSDVLAQYASAPNDGTLNAAAEIARSGILYVKSAGNKNGSEPDALGALPYFRPDIEKSWVSVANLSSSDPATGLADTSSICGMAKYYCVSARGTGIYSTYFDLSSGATNYAKQSGTSMAAPAVAGALGVVMERYPYLANEEIRTILLTTATHLGDGSVNVPNGRYGWGVPDLQKAMYGPGQLLGPFMAALPAGTSDTWSNDISDTALIARKGEERAEIAHWQGMGRTELEAMLQPVPAEVSPPAELVAGMAEAKALLREVIRNYTQEAFTSDDGVGFFTSFKALRANEYGQMLLDAYSAATPGFLGDDFSQPGDFDDFIAERSDTQLAAAILDPTREAIIASNKRITDEVTLTQARIDHLSSKSDADYVGSLVKDGGGILTLTGTNTYSGDTIVNGGELAIGTRGSITSTSFVNATGLLTVDGITADTTVNFGGRLRVNTSGLTGDVILNGGDASVDGRIGNTMVNRGSRLNLAIGGIAGDTLVNGGWTTINGKSGSTSVGGAGIVSGTGSVGSLIARTGGVVSPGNSVGTLNVSHSATFERGSIFEVEINADYSSADRLVVAGETSLLGGVVNVRLENDKALLSKDVSKSLFLKSFDILTAAKSVTGKFDGAWPRYNYITPTLDYTNKSKVALGFDFTPEVKTAKIVELERQLAEAEAEKKRLAEEEAKRVADAAAEKKRIAEAEAERARLVAEAEKERLEEELLKARIDGFLSQDFLAAGVKTSNQKAAWSGIQSLGADNNPLLEQIVGSTIDQPLDFDALSGEVHASLSGVLAADGHFIADAAAARVRNAFGGVVGKAQAVTTPPLAYGPQGKTKNGAAFTVLEPSPATTALWGEAYGSWAHEDGNSNASSYSRNTGGLVTGMDGIVADDWRFGLLAGYGSTSLHSGRGKASVDSYQLGVYGGTKIDAFGLRLGVNLGQHEIDTKRTARFGSFNNEHEASYDAQTVQVFGELGYEINMAHASFEPFAAARHVHVKTDGFNEDGAISNLAGTRSNTDLTITTLGLRAAHQFALSGTTTLTARGMLGWNHAFGDVTPQANLALDGSEGFTVEGAGIAKDAAIIEAGIDIGIGKATSIGLAYTGQFSNQSHDNAVKAGLSVRF